MKYSVLIKPEAERDLEYAFYFYEQQRIGLGVELLFAVEAEIKRIERKPLHFQKKHHEIRRSFTNRFPFAVFYFVQDSVIVVIAIVHTKTNDAVWKTRQGA
jgi:toxin ParE1/3/4